MMKISKPILTNEFLLSPVQFTSLNTIVFKNVKNVYDGTEKILLEYEHSSKISVHGKHQLRNYSHFIKLDLSMHCVIEASSRDWIGIFPRGWSTLQQYVTFEWVSQSLPACSNDQNKENGDMVRRAINFCPKYHMGSVNGSSFYQFVYISKQIEVLGVSSYFRFDTSSTNDAALELECLVPVSSKLRSTSVSDIGVLMANKISSATSLDTRTLQTTSIHSLQNLDGEGKSWTKAQVPVGASEAKKPSSLTRKSTGTGDALDPYSSHSEPIFPMTFQMSQCKKCFHFKRGGELVRSQQVLQSKLKIVMERNKVLEERTQEMKKEMERLQSESKRLKTSFYNIYKEKVAYEKFVKDFIKSLEKDSIVRVVNGNTEILVKKVNYVGMEEHPRDKKTSKRERELKAVIGLQEITIRNLINSLQEKAKSVQELNQTVKLAQAFSAAREDSREFASDAEETLDEVSNSDITSEYEFSLTKPPPPEEVAVEDTDTVLDDIRRATEMELKDIGITRSMGKISSRDSDSELGLASLSVRSYQPQSEATRAKKPRLFDSLDDCWPFVDNAPKVVHRKIIDADSELRDGSEPPPSVEAGSGAAGAEDEGAGTEEKEPSGAVEGEGEGDEGEGEKLSAEVEGEQLNFESYYDACEGFNPCQTQKEEGALGGEGSGSDEAQEVGVLEEKSDEEKTEKKNFLMTAIIPHDLDVKPGKGVEEWLKVDKADSEEKKAEAGEKGKKFTCQLSIDFGAKVVQSPTRENGDEGEKTVDTGSGEDIEAQRNNSTDVVANEAQLQLRDDTPSQREKPLLSFKQSSKCLEIQITQLEQKENSSKSYLQQKMIVKFGRDSQPKAETSKPSKFEFNLAVTGLRESGKLKAQSEAAELTLLPKEDGSVEVEASPRTVWNDASDDMAEEGVEAAGEEAGPGPGPAGAGAEAEAEAEQEAEVVEGEEGSEAVEEPREECVVSDMNLCEDSLRYERNLEFLQQKTEEKVKEEDVSKDKPTAILIQNGQTKLALIRYQ